MDECLHTLPAQEVDRLAVGRWQLLARRRAWLVGVARRWCPTLDDAEDVAQDALVRAARFSSLDESRVDAFLQSVVRRLAMDLHRRRARDVRLEQHAVHRPEPAPSPEDNACEQDEAAHLSRLVEALTPWERRIVRERSADLSLPQVAARLGTSVKAVEHAIARARRRLRRIIDA